MASPGQLLTAQWNAINSTPISPKCATYIPRPFATNYIHTHSHIGRLIHKLEPFEHNPTSLLSKHPPFLVSVSTGNRSTQHGPVSREATRYRKQRLKIVTVCTANTGATKAKLLNIVSVFEGIDTALFFCLQLLVGNH